MRIYITLLFISMILLYAVQSIPHPPRPNSPNQQLPQVVCDQRGRVVGVVINGYLYRVERHAVLPGSIHEPPPEPVSFEEGDTLFRNPNHIARFENGVFLEMRPTGTDELGRPIRVPAKLENGDLVTRGGIIVAIRENNAFRPFQQPFN